MSAAPAPAPPLPASGQACICCTNRGVLPAAKIDGQPVGIVGMVDGPTVLQCCEKCVAALFFGATHPHPLNPLLGVVLPTSSGGMP
jgi:hypothetical protein